MARLARSTAVGYPHHLVQRGHCDQAVFGSDIDYLRYLDWAREYSERFGVDIWAYCLMPNHVHFICVPKIESALARAYNSLHMRYAQYYNGKRGVAGPLWRPRFMSCILDEPSVNEEIRFVENNPVRAGIVSRAEDYAWSSAHSHVTGEPEPLLSDHGSMQAAWPDWRSYLTGGTNEALIRRVRERLRTGRPAGDPDFVRRLEEMLGRPLQARPRGRPRKAALQRSVQ
jgi:putative transposase